MRFGQLITGKARKGGYCKQCKEGVETGSEYVGLQYIRVGEQKRSYLIRFHRDCLFRYIDESQQIRDESVRKTGAGPGKKNGRPRATSTPEEAKERMLVQHNIWKAKNNLLVAYLKENKDKITFYWLKLADNLDRYASIGGENYGLGQEITKIVYEDSDFYSSLAECHKKPDLLAGAIRSRFGG